jgi:hypothetical protein
MTEQEVMDLENMLIRHKALPHHMELCITTDIEESPSLGPLDVADGPG